jgi:myristoyl-CoA:protein N-myristoyltransferase-like protein
MIRLNKVATVPSLPGMREMEDRDIDQVSDLFARYMKRFDMVQVFSLEELRHHFLSGKGTGAIGDGGPNRSKDQVVWPYVVVVKTQYYIYYISIHSHTPTGPRNKQDYRLFHLLFATIHDHQQYKAFHASNCLSLLLCY